MAPSAAHELEYLMSIQIIGSKVHVYCSVATVHVHLCQLHVFVCIMFAVFRIVL